MLESLIQKLGPILDDSNIRHFHETRCKIEKYLNVVGLN